MNALGGELRSLRQARGLSRAAAGAAIGVDEHSIGRYERGDSIPTEVRLARLLDLYRVPLGEIDRLRRDRKSVV